MRVLVVYGGASPEHEVSIRSAKTVVDALSKNHKVKSAYITKQDRWFLVKRPGTEDQIKKPLTYDDVSQKWRIDSEEFEIDVVFPIVHGVGGEDGTLQAKLDSWGVKYVGTKSEESRLCFDKIATKSVLRSQGIDVVAEIVVHNFDDVSFEDAIAKLGQVMFIKPSKSGSSVGVHKVNNEKDFHEALKDAFKYDTEVLIETAVNQPRELEISVLETKPGYFEVSEPGEIVADGEFYSYDAKYASESKSKTITDPDIQDSLKKQIKEVALKANKLLGCQDMVRIDFLQDSSTGILYLNEVNTLPGFTSISMYPMLWEATGMSIEELVDTMVNVSYQRSS